LRLKNKRRSIASFSEGEESPGCTGRRTPWKAGASCGWLHDDR